MSATDADKVTSSRGTGKSASARADKAAAAASAKGDKANAQGAPDRKNGLERTADSIVGQTAAADFRPSDLIDTAWMLAEQAIKQPFALTRASLGLLRELSKVATGDTKLAADPGDRRFADAAWQESTYYSVLMQSYLATRQSMMRYAQGAGLDARQTERAQFLLAQVADAFAPSNFLLGNPAALRHARETRGMSLLRGTQNLIGDVLKRRPIPSQVDESAFQVGVNLAATPGSVVLRTEMFELLQYAPQTETVYERPVLVVPSIVNKYYVFDLAPGRSILEYYVKKGFTVFVMAWRNPQERHDSWGLAAYQDAIEIAIDTTRAITNSPDVNLWAVCGAGPVVVSLLGYLAAKRLRKVNGLLLVVSLLDTQTMSEAPGVGAFADSESDPTPSEIKKALRSKRISAREFMLLFAMLRANDLIWSYWVNNYLMGNAPTAFDVLYWNNDGTGMTAQFNSDFSDVVNRNPLVSSGAMKMRGEPIADLAKLDIDSYVLGAATDHLCIWQGVYRSAQMLGERSQFVLGNSGHVQTIVCPPGTRKASFMTNDRLRATAQEWLETATSHPGSWWDHGVSWTAARSGELVNAPARQGNEQYPPLCPAPGTYVHERV